MKIIATIILLTSSLLLKAQQSPWDSWVCNFDPPFTGYESRFIIDTTKYPNNIWQIGRPNKALFDSAHSYPNVIVTDTLNAYPLNDTSAFIIKTVGFFPGSDTEHYWFAMCGMDFDYQLDIDPGEIALVEISANSGQNWINPITEDTIYSINWNYHPKPDLSNSTNGWKKFSLRFGNGIAPGLPMTGVADTLLIRFTFMSDSVETHKDGWILDNFIICNWTEGIKDLQNNHLITLYPNPSNGRIYIQKNQQHYTKPTISIYDLQGREVYKTDNIPASGYLELQLPDGVYSLKYAAGDEYAVKRLVIVR